MDTLGRSPVAPHPLNEIPPRFLPIFESLLIARYPEGVQDWRAATSNKRLMVFFALRASWYLGAVAGLK